MTFIHSLGSFDKVHGFHAGYNGHDFMGQPSYSDGEDPGQERP